MQTYLMYWRHSAISVTLNVKMNAKSTDYASRSIQEIQLERIASSLVNLQKIHLTMAYYRQ